MRQDAAVEPGAKAVFGRRSLGAALRACQYHSGSLFRAGFLPGLAAAFFGLRLFHSDLALRFGPLEQIALRFLRRGLGPSLSLGFVIDPGRNKGNRPAGIDESDGRYEVRR